MRSRRMSLSSRVCLLALWFVASIATAQDPEPESSETWTLVPAQPTTRDFFQVRYDSTGCSNVDELLSSTDRAAREISIFVGQGDLCFDEPFSHFLPIGYLSPGEWRIRFFGCLAQDMTICSPSSRPDQLFGVADEGRPRTTIPTWSKLAALGLALLIGLLAATRLPLR